MQDDILCQFEHHETTRDLCNATKERYGNTLLSKQMILTIKFDIHKIRPNHNMIEHIRAMSNMIRELQSMGHNLTNK